MTWWDERSILAWHHAEQGLSTTDSSPEVPCHQLIASVDLDCEYVRSIVIECFARRANWRLDVWDDEADPEAPCISDSLFHWGEYERIDWAKVHEGKLHSSSYCVRKGLIRKAHLAHNCKKWAAKHPDGALAKAVPETYIMEIDHPEYLEEALCDIPEVRDMEPGSITWIAKPSITNQAIGICIFNCVPQLQEAVEAEEAEDLHEWVIQRYIDRPLLVQGRKFHLRVYALCVGSLSAYVFSEGLALFAGEPYVANATDFSRLGAHLTNTCAFERAGGFEGGKVDERDIVKLISELPQALVDEGMAPAEAAQRMAQVWRDASAAVGECFEAVSHELTFFTLPNCFELFGFDLMVDADWHVWLLEANAEPDLMQTGDRLRPLITGLVEGICRLVVDPLAAQQGLPSPACSDAPTPAVGSGVWESVYVSDRRAGFGGASGIRMT